MAMTIVLGNGLSFTYHTAHEIIIKEDGTVICCAVDTDGNSYRDVHKMINGEIEVLVE